MAELPTWLWAAVALAAFLQAGGGAGFGLLAVPALVVAVGGAAAIQIALLLGLIVALALLPAALPHVDRGMLRQLLAGIVPGALPGAALLALMPGSALPALVAFGLLAAAVVSSGLAARVAGAKAGSMRFRLVLGATTGAMAGACALPDPPLAALPAGPGAAGARVGATRRAGLAAAFPAGFLAQAAVHGVAPEVWLATAALTPAMGLGAMAGFAYGPRVPAIYDPRNVTAALLLGAVALVL
ncbi:hypothetical protein [Chachezhania sediminis]|uniref:hypothetical protein n=1 Tax=Chachezhania sediminis TaxID=2599291 RepID=UPI00131B2E06|nr:hypothetical protein [Chachezhania sediminis]